MNSTTIEEFIKHAENYGFESILCEQFKDKSGYDNLFVIMWHPDGLLISADTYSYSTGRILNSATMYYNLMLLAPRKEWFSSGALSSGYMYWSGPITETEDNLTNIWVGYHRIIKSDIDDIINNKLRNLGIFLKKWVDSSSVMLHTYADPIINIKNIEKFSQLNKEKTLDYFKKMPPEVGNMLSSVYRRII